LNPPDETSQDQMLTHASHYMASSIEFLIEILI